MTKPGGKFGNCCALTGTRWQASASTWSRLALQSATAGIAPHVEICCTLSITVRRRGCRCILPNFRPAWTKFCMRRGVTMSISSASPTRIFARRSGTGGPGWPTAGLLQPGIRRRDLYGHLQAGMRVADTGITLLVDYGIPQEPVTRHLVGHAAYTRPEWLLFHTESIVEQFYGSDAMKSGHVREK